MIGAILGKVAETFLDKAKANSQMGSDGQMISPSLGSKSNETPIETTEFSNGSESESNGDASASGARGALSGIASALSDERLKELFPNSKDIVKTFSDINAYEFNYTPEALRLYEGTCGVDKGTNTGVMAQELEQNPLTENTVIEDENTGYKQIDTNKLTTTNSAVLSDVCKRLIALEQKLGIQGE